MSTIPFSTITRLELSTINSTSLTLNCRSAYCVVGAVITLGVVILLRLATFLRLRRGLRAPELTSYLRNNTACPL